MKKILKKLTLIILFFGVVTLTMFTQNVYAAAKTFVVGEVLPASTQLRISWYGFIGIEAIIQTDNGSFNLTNSADGGDMQFVNNVQITSGGRDSFSAPYTNGLGDHGYIDIDTSLWTLSKRTVSNVNNIVNYYSWEDMVIPMERRNIRVGDDLSGKKVYVQLPAGVTLSTIGSSNLNDGNTLRDGLQYFFWNANHKGILWTYGYADNYEISFENVDTTHFDLTEEGNNLYTYVIPADYGIVTELSTNTNMMDVKADFEISSGYSVTFEENGGSAQIDLIDQSVLPALPSSIKTGSTFQGWYYENTFLTQAQANDVLNADVTLYAKWGLNDPKVFAVGDYLPATTQLRIRWTNDITNPPISVKTDSDSFSLINSVTTGYEPIYVNGTIIYDWNQSWYAPYTDYDGDHAYIDINTSAWSVAKRTVSSVSLGTANITWKDMVVVDTAAPVWYGVPDGNISTVGMDSTRTLAELITYYMIDLIDAVDGYIVPTITVDNYTVNKTIPGDYIVKLDGVDAAGNHAQQLVLTLQVVDNVAPIWSGVPAANTLDVNSNTSATLTESLAAIKLTDNVDGNLVYTITEDGYTTNKTIPGNYTVKLDGVDAAGNHAVLLVLTIHVVDAVAPVWSGVPADNTVTLNSNTVATLLESLNMIKLTDETDGDLSYTAVEDGYTANKNKVGTYTVKLDGTDAAGNHPILLVLTINVVDIAAPVWTNVPANNTVTAYSNTVMTLRQILGVTLVDETDGNLVYTIVEDNYTANKNKVGTYTVKLDGEDNAGNHPTMLVLTINVVDITAPVWSGVPAANTYNIAVNNTPLLAEVLKDLKLTDDTDGELEYVITLDEYSANRTVMGNYTVKLDGIDLSGNHAAQLVLMIIVETAIPPVFVDLPYSPFDTVGENHLDFYEITLNTSDVTAERTYTLPAGYDGFHFTILNATCTNAYIDFSATVFNFGTSTSPVIWFTIDHSVIIGANSLTPATYSASKVTLWVDSPKLANTVVYDPVIYFVANDGIIGSNNLYCDDVYIRNVIYLHQGIEVHRTGVHSVSYPQEAASPEEIQNSYDSGHEQGYSEGLQDAFMSGFKDWIVPAIILVLLIGGYFAIRRRQE